MAEVEDNSNPQNIDPLQDWVEIYTGKPHNILRKYCSQVQNAKKPEHETDTKKSNEHLITKKPIIEETDVTPSAGRHINDSFDLALYKDKGDRGILVVTIVLQMYFKDDDGYSWTSDGRKKWAEEYVKAIPPVWENKYPIVTESDFPEIKNVKVQLDIRPIIDEELILKPYGKSLKLTWLTDSSWHDHWELHVSSRMTHTSGGSQVEDSGYVALETLDIYKRKKYGFWQRDGVHEFGHMIGLGDEYPESDGALHKDWETRVDERWESDRASIMNAGEIVRPRHYVLFADWLSKKFDEIRADYAKDQPPVVFKVYDDVRNDYWDLSNSGLGYE